MKKILVLLLVLALVFAACTPASQTGTENKPNQGTENQGTENQGTEGGDKPETPETKDIVARSQGITLRSRLTATPATLNGHDTTTADAGDITGYTEIGFFGIRANATGDGFEFIPELAAEFPTDVTKQYAGDETYGVPADATAEYAWSVKLNPNAKWEDGTPITADDYIYSYSQLLSPEMKNVRAEELYSGYLSLANAEAYFKNGYESVAGNAKAENFTEDQYVFSMTETVYFFGGAAADYYENEDYKSCFIAEDGTDIYAKYSAEKYVPLTEEAKAELNYIASGFGDSNPEAWKEFCLIYTGIDSFEKVGMKKINDHEIHFILGAPTNDFFIKYTLTGTWLVNEEMYESNKVKTGDLTKTSYGSDNTKYMAFGPYKITEYIKDKLVVLSMNENWYGWTDGNHEYLMNAATIRYDVIPDSEVAFQMFLQGKLESIGIIAGKEEYATSEYLFSMPNRYTYNLNFHADRDNLKNFEEEGINKTMLSYKDFRQAISLGINRVNFNKALGPLDKPISGLLNETYITDPYTGQSYRDSEYGKQVLIDVYGGTDVDAGYDVAKARELVNKAYEEAKANGDYKDGDVIVVKYPRPNESDFGKLLANTIETSVLEILKGTPLEGKFKVEILITDVWSEKMQSGEGQVSMSGGGGGAMDPYGLMEFNIRPNGTYGINYSDFDLTLTVEGKEYTYNLVKWMDEVINGQWRTAESDIRAYIMSRVEAETLLQFASVPIQSSSVDSLMSMRTEKQLDQYVPLVGYGETYFLMTDEEWDAFVEEEGGTLEYK